MGVPRERRMIAEYMAEKFVGSWFRLGMPLGPVPGLEDGEFARERVIGLARPWRPEVDAAAVHEGVLYIIEAKIFKAVQGLGALEVYANLVDETPELEAHRGLEVRKRLVIAHVTPQLAPAARKLGIEVEVFRPRWLEEYVEAYNRYLTRDERLARALRNQRRRELHLE